MSADGDSMAGQLPTPRHDAPEQLLDGNSLPSSIENISLSTSARDAPTSAVDSGLPEQHAAQVPHQSQGAEWPVFEDLADDNLLPSLGDTAEKQLPNGVSDPDALWKAALDDDELLDDSNANETANSAHLSPQGEQWDLGGSWNSSITTGQTSDGSLQAHSQLTGNWEQNMANSQDLTQSISEGQHGLQQYAPAQWQPQPPAYTSEQTQQGQFYGQRGQVAPSSLDWAVQGVGTSFNRSSTSLSGSGSNGSKRNSFPWAGYQQAQQTGEQRPEQPRAQSFVDKSKGGYSSPYDIPADLTKPRRRANVQHAGLALKGQPPQRPGIPPPRSSSFYSAQQPEVMAPLQNVRSASAAPPLASQPPFLSQDQAEPNVNKTVAPPANSRANTTSFFEDLPVVGPKRPTAGGRPLSRGMTTTPSMSAPPAPIPGSNVRQAPHDPSYAQRPPSESPPLLAPAQLQPPDRLDPYADPMRPNIQTRSASMPAARYSPVPPQMTAPGRSKYAPVPTGTAPPIRSHQPRTSSPLVNRSFPAQDQPEIIPAVPEEPEYDAHDHVSGPSRDGTGHFSLAGPPPGGADQQSSILQGITPSRGLSGTPPGHNLQPSMAAGNDNNYEQHDAAASSLVQSPPSFYSPKQPSNAYPAHAYPAQRAQRSTQPTLPTSPPRRSQTQSVGLGLYGQPAPHSQQVPIRRPASVDVPEIPGPMGPSLLSMAGQTSSGRVRGYSQEANYIMPTDGRERDDLSRWRGCPIFHWGFGGTIVTTFPKAVQRYTSGQVYPSIKFSPAEVKILSAKEILPLPGHVSQFPGPLRGKGKKKEAISWLSLRIEHLASEVREGASMLPAGEVKRRVEELLLVSIVRILVEHDGATSPTESAQKAFHEALVAHQSLLPNAAPYGTPHAGIDHSVGSLTRSQLSESTDPGIVYSIRTCLLNGQRESAVWQAVDKRMWGHALLISSATSPALWKQVVQEFIRNEVRQAGPGTESLAALYQIFAGNSEESIDELVPPSARAGLQLISTTVQSTAPKNGLDGLDKWLETLTLVLSNRSASDGQALVSLGRLLLAYGRTEAAHVCCLFAAPFVLFGSADDPQKLMTLLGRRNELQFRHGDPADAILLTEIYEFALSLGTPNFSAPHLQAYKLYHAQVLAQHGHLTEAQQYCESLAQAIKAAAKPSAQYYSLLAPAVEELSKRLQRSLKDGSSSSSWISKPSIEKVSDSLFARFNSFVAGNEGDDNPAGPGEDQGAGDVGPFARIAGNTPIISRPASQNDTIFRGRPLDGHMPGVNRSVTGPVGVQGRYTPVSAYVPQLQPAAQQQTGPYLPRSREVSAETGSSFNDTGVSAEYPGFQGSSQFQGYSASAPHLPVARRDSSLKHSTVPTASFDDPPANVPEGSSFGPYAQPSYQPALNSEKAEPPQPENSRVADPANSQPPNGGGGATYMPYTSGYQPSSYEPPSYEPPSFGQSYEPPSANEATDEDGQAASNDAPRKKKGFMDDDDDDDIGKRAAELARREKARKDKEAEENFKKAAAADAKHSEQASGEKKGWFGGWFSKKDAANGLGGPIKAKLGEENSFYYDTELKKWVNKKAGTSQTRSVSTPPPPRSSSTSGSRNAADSGGDGRGGSTGGSGAGPPPPPSALMPPPRKAGTPAAVQRPAAGLARRPSSANAAVSPGPPPSSLSSFPLPAPPSSSSPSNGMPPPPLPAAAAASPGLAATKSAAAESAAAGVNADGDGGVTAGGSAAAGDTPGAPPPTSQTGNNNPTNTDDINHNNTVVNNNNKTPTGSVPPAPPAPKPASKPTPPPSRPATLTSTDSSIDDLLGPPSAGGRSKSAASMRKAKKGRYIDVIASATAAAAAPPPSSSSSSTT